MTAYRAEPLSPAPQPRPELPELPELEAGDHLDQPTFHERYEAMPTSFRAELIEGIVHVPSPLKPRHGGPHLQAAGWILDYTEQTPGTVGFDNTTHILGKHSEPQPDLSLLFIGGQTKENEEGHLVGAPELVIEIASSSVAIDLHAKKRDYERYGVQEYVVIITRDERVMWFVREQDRLVEKPSDADQIHRSRMFAGLWLDGAALLRRDTTRVREVLKQGLATPEHAAFCAALAARNTASGS